MCADPKWPYSWPQEHGAHGPFWSQCKDPEAFKQLATQVHSLCEPMRSAGYSNRWEHEVWQVLCEGPASVQRWLDSADDKRAVARIHAVQDRAEWLALADQCGGWPGEFCAEFVPMDQWLRRHAEAGYPPVDPEKTGRAVVKRERYDETLRKKLMGW